MAYATINPATGETLKKFDTATDQEIKDAVQRSAKEYSSWRNVPVAERAKPRKIQVGTTSTDRQAIEA